ncbi:hypothetical protein CNR22_19240 [Sphingobacteriaceae bacterium]|nr:hypothetical protein CNR22_19240 [Sphingobacteriaceae bacterium]
MKKIILIVAGLLFACSVSNAQVTDNLTNKRYIEITGTNEMEITPDELYITITLLERMEGKEKITIDKQEAELKKSLKELNIDLANLTLSKADADYGKVRKSNKDVLVSKAYILKVGDAEMLSKVYEKLDKINAYDAYISRYTHSKILDFQKECRIKAIKVAKEKVDYILAAVDQKAGTPIQIMETENYVQDQPPVYGYGRMDKMAMNSVSVGGNAESSDISFKKIKIRSGFLVRYEILTK